MIERMTPIIEKAPLLHAFDYDVKFIAALTGSPPPPLEGPSHILAAERNRLLAPPWSFDLPIEVLSVVPTVVLTGDWNAEYEEIGKAMADAGSRHAHLVGYGHRVQDHPDANSVIADWVSRSR
jgi:hypothetical protein